MSPHTYKRELSSLRIFIKDYLERPELVKTFRFPKVYYKPIIAPSREDIKKLSSALDIKYKALLIMFATTGLRHHELLSVTIDQIDLDRRMIILGKNSKTKRTWVTFFNEEAEAILQQYLAIRQNDEKVFPIGKASVLKMFRKIGKEIGVYITPQKLRDWFCCEMGELGVPDRYIDAFCGRVPRSILARHYTDYSPERLKRIYDRANLKVLS